MAILPNLCSLNLYCREDHVHVAFARDWPIVITRSCPTPTTTRNLDAGRGAMDPQIDLVADLNGEDDDGLGWSVLSEGRDPSRVRPGVMLVAGNPPRQRGRARAGRQ